MSWNWQQPDWPNFKWDRSRISAAEEQFLLGAGVAIGTVKHLGEDEHNQLLVEVMSGEAVTTSAIEGEVLNRASVQSSILRQLGLASPDKRRVMPAEQGIAEMMVDLYRSFSQPLSDRNVVWLAPDGDFRQERPRRHWKIPHQPGTHAGRLRSNRCSRQCILRLRPRNKSRQR